MVLIVPWCGCCQASSGPLPRWPRRATSGLLEYPHYTRPREWEGRAIPDVLLTGDHKKIADWRRAEAERLTRDAGPACGRGTGKSSSTSHPGRGAASACASGAPIRDLWRLREVERSGRSRIASPAARLPG